MKHKMVVCSGSGECEKTCRHQAPHYRDMLAFDLNDVKWCTEWNECEMIGKKVRCTKVKEAT